MRTCEKCGKANQPTRKFCIRCGASLIKEMAPQAAQEPVPTPEAPAAPEPAKSTPPPVSTTTDDHWVKPSQVSRDRVRVAGGSKQKSELEKAKEAFAKAETVGIDEADGSGVIETRMLRASEVKELLEGPGMMSGQGVPPPTMMEGSEPLPPETSPMVTPSMPTSEQIEESILGSRSAYVEKAPEPVPEPEGASPSVPPSAAPAMEEIVATTVPPEAPKAAAGFTSAKYEGVEESAPPGTEEEATTGFTPQAPPVTEAPPPKTTTIKENEVDLVIACPDCGKTINVDMFEYPKEVYRLMGEARLKQARFFIVQGKGKDALRIIRMAHALYTKAEDKIGLAEVKKLIETLAKKP